MLVLLKAELLGCFCATHVSMLHNLLAGTRKNTDFVKDGNQYFPLRIIY